MYGQSKVGDYESTMSDMQMPGGAAELAAWKAGVTFGPNCAAQSAPAGYLDAMSSQSDYQNTLSTGATEVRFAPSAQTKTTNLYFKWVQVSAAAAAPGAGSNAFGRHSSSLVALVLTAICSLFALRH